MEDIRTKGIVIDTKDYREYDKIITIFTYDLGVIKAVLKGVKKSTAKSRFEGQLFCFIDLILSKKGEGDLYTVISCDLIESFFEIAYNYDNFLLAVDIVKIIKFVSKYHPDSTELFVVFLSILNVLLKTKAKLDLVYTKFLLMTLKVLGFEQQFVICNKCGNRLENGAKIDLVVGGVVCSNCASRQGINLSKENLDILNKLNNLDYAELQNIEIEQEDSIKILKSVQTIFKVSFNQ